MSLNFLFKLTAKSGKIKPLFIKITVIKEFSQFY